jgi:pSer/pThr/pTyr-binding forkhead associated (FHA) protein
MSLEWILLGFRILAAVILYTFLGLAFYIIWRDLKSAAARNSAQSAATPTHLLRVVGNAGNGTLGRKGVFLLQPITLLGRDPDNTIVLTDSAAAARHARLCRQRGVWWLEDLGSGGGTMLNEAPLSEPTPMAPGDIIGIGELRLRLETVTE